MDERSTWKTLEMIRDAIDERCKKCDDLYLNTMLKPLCSHKDKKTNELIPIHCPKEKGLFK